MGDYRRIGQILNTWEGIMRDEMVVYLDVYFGLNLWMDVVLIGITAGVCKERIRTWRLVVAACMGATMACVWLAVGRKWQLIGVIVGAMVVVKIVFPHMRKYEIIRTSMIYLLASVFVGGVINWWYFELSEGRVLKAAGVAMIGALVFAASMVWIKVWRQKRRRERDTYRVLLRIQGRDIITAGFLDTGNCLRDDLGRPVHICEKEVIFGKGTSVEGGLSITYNTLSGEGRIQVVVADRLLVPELGVDEEKALIGLTEERLFKDGRCHMLLNGVLGEGR